MALLNEAIAPGVLTHIADHDVISRVVNERHGVNVINPVAGQHYAPDMALGETHVINLPAAGVVTLDAPVSTDPVRAWLPGAELVIVLVSPAGSTASVAWAAAYAAGGAPVPQAGSSVVGRWRNITVDANPAVWVPAAAPSGAFAGDLRAAALSSTDVALVAKGFAGQTADLQQWQNSAGTALAKVSNLGVATAAGFLTTASGNAMGGAAVAGYTLALSAPTATTNVLLARGAASQSADLQQWQNSAAAVLARVNATGQGTFAALTSTGGLTTTGGLVVTGTGNASIEHGRTDGVSSTPFMDFHSGATAVDYDSRLIASGGTGVSGAGVLSAYVGQFAVVGGAATSIPAVVKSAPATTAALMQWQDSVGAAKATMWNTGAMWVNALQDSSGSGPYISFNSGTGIGAVNQINAANVPFSVQGMTGQTGDLQDWKDATGAVLARIGATGGAFMTGPAAWMNAQVNASAAQAGWSAIVARGFAGQTADLQQWQNSAGTVLTNVDSGGVLRTQDFYANGAVNARFTTYQGAALAAKALTATEWGALVRGAASQTADLQQWQNSAASVLVQIGASGDTSTVGVVQAGQLMGTGWLGGALSAKARSAADIAQVVRAFASQTADLTQWQTAAGTVMSKVDANGNAFINAVYVGSNGASVGGSQASIVSPAAGQIAFAIKAAASQTADLTRWLDSGNVVKAFVRNDGQIQSNTGIVVGSQATGSGGGAGGAMTSQSPAANQVAMIAKGAAGQTAALHEWQNSAGTVKAYVDATGVVGSQGSYGANVAAFSADLRNSASTASIGLYVTMQSGQAGDAIDIGTSTGSQVARITSSGNVQGTGAYTTLSDASAKTNVRGLVHDPLDVIRRLKPRHFDYRGEMFGGERDQVGFVAQELQAVLPQAVVAFDDRLGTRSEAIVAYLVAAVQELDRRLAA